MGSKSIAINAISVAILCLALSLCYFTYELSQIRKQIPEILIATESTTARVEPALQQLNEVRDLVPPILEEVARVRVLVPDILREIESTRNSINPILNEVAEIRAVIPTIVDEIAAVRGTVPVIVEEVEQVKAEMPNILKTVDNASDAIKQTANEVEALRPLISEAITEVEITRNSIPSTLDRVDSLIVKADIAGQKATEGAVTGIFTGVLKTPFKLFGGFSDLRVDKDVIGIQSFSKEDVDLASEALQRIDSNRSGSNATWSNPNTNMRGTLTLVKTYKANGRRCATIKNDAWKKDNQVARKQFDICRNENGEWRVKQPQ